MRTVNEANGHRTRFTRNEAMQNRYAARQRQAANVCLKAATIEMLSELTEFVNDFEPEGIHSPEDNDRVYPAMQRFYEGLRELNASFRDDLSR
jgi:hypothetical protein